ICLMPRFYQGILWGILVLVAVLSVLKANDNTAWSPVLWQPAYQHEQANEAIPFYDAMLIPNAGQNSTHSVGVGILPNGDIMAFWFAGSREGHQDVQIFQTTFSKIQQTWAEPQPMLDVAYLDDVLGRYIGKIGNPVVFLDSQQRLWLFFVTVSYGGWAGSNINVMWSQDLGQHWNRPKRLITSPFINVSTLVRNPPVELEDGSLLLPVYHEFVAQFPESLRISRTGEVMSKTRMFGHNGGIQPVFFQGEADTLHALMRSGVHSHEARVKSIQSLDAGQTWQDYKVTNIANPNAAVVAARAGEKLWLLVANDDEESRDNMSLAVSHDLTKPWQMLFQFDQEKGKRFAYPAMIQGKDGLWHVFYTHERKHIKHIRFNDAWLQQQMKQQVQQAKKANKSAAIP
ncbi:MAG: sialidase family protein, partial [Mariprofundaceae bacterium]|nr:sialidase family protein [Mariprofundaceae bacterium]